MDGDSHLAEVVWSYPVSNPYESKVEPAIDKHRVYVAADLRMRAFELEEGNLIWESARLREEGSFGKSLVYQDHDRLFVDSGPRVTALSKSDGSVLWHTEIDGLATYAFTRMGETDQHLFVGGLGEVVRLVKADGRIDLRIPIKEMIVQGAEHVVNNPVISNGLLYVPVLIRVPDVRGHEGRLLIYDASNGSFVDGVSVPPRKELVSGDSVYIDRGGQGVLLTDDLILLNATSSIFALDRRTRETRWEWFANDGIGDGIASGGGAVYSGSTNGVVYAVDLATGNLLWRVQTPGFIQRVSYKNGRLYHCNTGSGRIIVQDATNGDVLLNKLPPGYEQDEFDTFLSPLAVGEEYMVNVGPRRIYALRAQ